MPLASHSLYLIYISVSSQHLRRKICGFKIVTCIISCKSQNKVVAKKSWIRRFSNAILHLVIHCTMLPGYQI